MNETKIYQKVEKILDEWDPIGILQEAKPITYLEGTIGEYTRYVKPIIESYLSNQSIYDYLIKLQTDLCDYPNESMKEEIKLMAARIINLLSQYALKDIPKNY